MKKNKENKYKYIGICYFSCLPHIDKDEYFEALEYYSKNKFDEQILKEFELFWNTIKVYVRALNKKNLPVSSKKISLRKDKEDFKDKMRKLYKCVEEISKNTDLKWWQTKALVAFSIWRKKYTLKDLLQTIHQYFDRKNLDILTNK